MKKVINLAICLILFNTVYCIPPGAWLSQIFGRTCSVEWPPGGETANIGAGTNCTPQPPPANKCCNEYVEVCKSWLWGNRENGFSQWGDCFSSDLPSRTNPSNNNSVFADMAQFWTINSNITGVDPDWTNPNILTNNSEILMESIIFRFRLAGYDCNASWFTPEGVCNFHNPPTLNIIVPLPENQLDAC